MITIAAQTTLFQWSYSLFIGAVLSMLMLPHWVGWLSVVYRLVGLVLVGFTPWEFPAISPHLMPILIGVLLLLRQGQISPEKDE